MVKEPSVGLGTTWKGLAWNGIWKTFPPYSLWNIGAICSDLSSQNSGWILLPHLSDCGAGCFLVRVNFFFFSFCCMKLRQFQRRKWPDAKRPSAKSLWVGSNSPKALAFIWLFPSLFACITFFNIIIYSHRMLRRKLLWIMEEIQYCDHYWQLLLHKTSRYMFFRTLGALRSRQFQTSKGRCSVKKPIMVNCQ